MGRRSHDSAMLDRFGGGHGGRMDRPAGVHALGVGRARRVAQHLPGGERGVPVRVAVVGGDGHPAQQVGPVVLRGGRLVGRHQALQQQQPGRVAEVRDHDVDQPPGQLVQVEGGPHLPERLIQQRMPHQRGVKELLHAGRWHAQDRQRRRAPLVVAAHRLQRDHGVDGVAALGLEGEHRGRFPASLDRVKQTVQRRPCGGVAHHQIAQVRAEQRAVRRIKDFLRIPVMLNYPSGRIYPQDQCPHGSVG